MLSCKLLMEGEMVGGGWLRGELMDVDLVVLFLQLLEQDITNHQKIHDLLDTVKTFKEQNHFMYEEMNARIKTLFER